ncbi:uncharacterized protein EHS24_005692 [Apiotrichum porosum]|uniref:Uncharacterized protein n=1 Tax=Apiotrichum porosum TaxID=105984 RepID=A0A427XZE5_9TREE|nr:uncharacterized protein EHS24_005692 [Apiotrichum porosum]RSH84183.1 hypothetical protein EHS24_005692 [Apiotrichum porosum]
MDAFGTRRKGIWGTPVLYACATEVFRLADEAHRAYRPPCTHCGAKCPSASSNSGSLWNFKEVGKPGVEEPPSQDLQEFNKHRRALKHGLRKHRAEKKALDTDLCRQMAKLAIKPKEGLGRKKKTDTRKPLTKKEGFATKQA